MDLLVRWVYLKASMNKNAETIYALSTARGKSALALIRISGPDACGIIRAISTNMPKNSNIATLNEIRSEKGLTIDQTITTFYKSPKSFTGEDMVEIATHGSNAVIKKIFEIFSKNKKMRLATPGEFTRRAFENNKLDLTQVEAIADLVEAETEMQRRQAISHLSGNFFKSTKKIFDDLKEVLANIEAIIDFTDEDLPPDLIIKIREQIKNTIIKINKILSNSSVGISLREGFVVAILGKANTGKSSFINNISGKDISIVTNQPGTTRDLIESFLDLEGYPVKFIDTAGIRESGNLVEKIGVEKALLLAKEADINLVFIECKKDIVFFRDIKNTIFVKSKQDVLGGAFKEGRSHNISSKNSFGIKELLSLLKKKIQDRVPLEMGHISRERHAKCLFLTKKYLEDSQKNKNIDLFAEDVRLALKNLSSLFGSVDIEDILDIIFSDFCIGK
jgi:tRNA modification GTPase